MKVNEAAASADSIALVARALRSIDTATVLRPAPAPRRAKLPAQRSLKSALRHCESEVRLLSAQFMSAQELERQRLARELHDSVGQALGGVKFALESCQAQIAGCAGDAAARTLRQLSGRIGAVMEEVRRVSMNLRPATLDDLGILPTLAGLSREFRAIHPQLELELLVEVREAEIAAPLKTAIYRIVQEALHNVVLHSGARKVCLVLRGSGSHLELQVQDNGVGLGVGAAVVSETRCGLGLSTMRERAEITGGRFTLRAEKGRGTTVAVTWPIYNEAVRS